MIVIKLDDIAHLRQFIGTSQLRVILKGTMGEEGEHFRDKLTEYGERIKAMPKTYEQDGLGDAAVAHLHYFTASTDHWITEKDCDPDGEGQIQAFGLASLGYEPELGYISIKELLQCGAELDLYWTPQTLGEVKASIQAGLEFEGAA